jgi:hypothetical protein
MTRRSDGRAQPGSARPAAALMILVGVFQSLQGIAALNDDEVFAVRPDSTYDLDVTAWGWGHLIIGAIVVLTGFFLSTGSATAGGVAIGLAGMSAIANFAFIPYYPFWATLIIALDVFVIWAVARSGVLES